MIEYKKASHTAKGLGPISYNLLKALKTVITASLVMSLIASPVYLHNHNFLESLDLISTSVFGLTGSMTGFRFAKKNRPNFTFFVLLSGVLTGVAGGTIRSLALAHAPGYISDGMFLFAAFAGSLLGYALSERGALKPHEDLIGAADAIGLGTFVITGSQAIESYGLPIDDGRFWSVHILGSLITGVGGGLIRDITLKRKPTIITTTYAIASLAGSCLYYVLSNFEVSFSIRATLTILTVAMIYQLTKKIKLNQ